jgi:hypothetical protein
VNVVLKNPEDVWTEVHSFSGELVRDLKSAMRDFVVFEDVTAGNVRFDFSSFNGFFCLCN